MYADLTGDCKKQRIKSLCDNNLGVGHDWVKKRFIQAKSPDTVFIQASVYDNPALMEEMKEAIAAAHPGFDPEMAKGCFRGAPTMIFIARDLSYDFSAYDCGLLAQNIMLSACSLGVGSVCLGSPVRFLTDNELCKPYVEKLGFSEGYSLRYALAVGYPNEEPEAKSRDLSKIKFVE